LKGFARKIANYFLEVGITRILDFYLEGTIPGEEVDVFITAVRRRKNGMKRAFGTTCNPYNFVLQ
jgi:hypothetical protein